MEGRNKSIDVMRAIGTLLVILAHVSAPNVIINLRTFDVVMLVLISGMCMSPNISNLTLQMYFGYLWKRIKKLWIPTVFLIIIVLLIRFIACFFLKKPFPELIFVMRSFLLLEGNSIGMVWIVRIYLGIALLWPVIAFNNKVIKSNYLYICFFVLGIVFCVLFNTYCTVNDYITDYIFYTVIYAFIAGIGMRIQNDKGFVNKILPIIILLFVFFQIQELWNGNGFCPQDAKNPPGAYYILYGLMTSIMIYQGITCIINKKSRTYSNTLIKWISENSFTIYLIHIIVMQSVFVIDYIINSENIVCFWLIKYFYVVLLTFFLSWIYLRIKRWVKTQYNFYFYN